MRVARLYILFFLCCWLFSSPAIAQELSYRQYTPDNGLASSEAHCVLQDSKGYIWFATDRGVCRYNGYTFETFTVQHGLGDNVVFTMAEDANGTIWFSTFSAGIYCYTDERGFFPAPFNEPLKKAITGGWVHAIVFDEYNRPWMSVKNNKKENTFYYAGKADTIYEYMLPGFKPTETVLCKIGNNWLSEVKSRAAEGGNISLAITTDGKKNYGLQSPVKNINSCIALSPDSLLFTYNHFVILVNQKNTEKKIIDVKSEVLNLYKDKDGKIWVLTKNGAYIYGNITALPEGHYLQGKSISHLLHDSEGNYWFATLDQGVYMATSLNFKIYHTVKEKVSALAIFADRVYGITFSKKVFSIDNEGKESFISTGIHYFPPIANDSGSITQQDHLFFEELAVRADNKIFPNRVSSRTKCFINVKNGRFFGFTEGFIFYDNIQKKRVYSSKVNFNQRVNALCTDDGDNVWVGTLFGLHRYSLANGTLYNYPQLKQRVNGLAYNKTKNIIIAGTAGAGICFITTTGYSYSNENDGLAGNYISAVLLQNDSVLWVGTNKGMSRVLLDKDGLPADISTCTTYDGLPSNEINAFVLKNGKLWIATNSGLTYINPQSFRAKNARPTPVYVTNIFINDSAIGPGDEKLDLTYNQRNLTISYSDIVFGNPAATRYFYKMEGLHADWVKTTLNNVKFVNLPAGEYVFLIAAINGPGNMLPDKFASINIHIAPHFAQTWWFISLCILAVLLLVVYGLYVFVSNHKKKLATQTKMVLAEQRALRAQMNPHFIFNALNSVQYYISENDKRSAGIFLSKFSSLIRAILENSNQSTITLEEELACIQKYLELEYIRFGNKFSYTMHIDEELPLADIKIPSMLIQPFLENAIWHGLMPKEQPGRLLFSLTKADNAILCVIEDNGIGRQNASQIKRSKPAHTSTAINNTEERLRLIKQLSGMDIYLEITDLFDNGQPSGTRVCLTFKTNY